MRGNFYQNLDFQIKSNQPRCEECPLLEDEDDISDEEMEQLVSISFFSILIYVSHSHLAFECVKVLPPSVMVFSNFQTRR